MTPDRRYRLGRDARTVVMLAIVGAFLVCVARYVIDPRAEIPSQLWGLMAALMAYFFRDWRSRNGNNE